MNCIINCPYFFWSTRYLTEQIYIELISSKEEDGITLKYQKRAKWLLRRIPVFNVQLPFIIYKKDLSERTKKELIEIAQIDFNFMKNLVKRSIEMIFESLDEVEEPLFNNRHFLLSIKRHNKLIWRFDTPEDKENDPNSKYELNLFEYNDKGKIIGKVKDKKNYQSSIKTIKEIGNS